MRKTFILFFFFLPCLLFAQINAIDGVCLNKAVPDGRVDSVYLGIDLPQSFTGEDVIIGVTDWGFDYTHPVFYDLPKENYRILRAWDQYRNEGPAPEGYDYGTEIVGQEQLLAAQCDTFNVYEYFYHGTHVASIAAGSGKVNGNSLRGVAPGANIILCSILVSEQAVIDAFRWMYQVAQQEQKRLVINCSWSLFYLHYMDGTGPIAETMQELSEQGVIFVASAGNNGDVKFHLHQNFNTNTDTLKSLIKFATGGGAYTYGQSITMLSSPNTSFSYALAVTSASGTIYGCSPFYNTQMGDFSLDTLAYIADIPVEYRIENIASTETSARPNVRLRLKKSSYGGVEFALIVAADEGDFHAWNVIELTNGVGNWGGVFSSAGTGWTAGDKEYSIGCPANVSCAISVAAHQARQKNNTTGQFTGNGSMAYFSSWGPTLDDMGKPEVSAPGVEVTAALSSYTNAGYTPTNAFSFNGRTYGFYALSGTSMSSPFVAGVVALMLEANPYLTPEQVKSILKETAYQDQYTESSQPLVFGAGKVDAYQAVLKALQITGVEHHQVSESRCRVYPNPVENKAFVVIEGDESQYDAQLFDMSGRLLQAQQLSSGVNTLDMQTCASGCYFLRVNDGKTVITRKVVKK
jgi:subtilisin family serine protease